MKNRYKLKQIREIMLEEIRTGLKIIINADDFGYCQERDQGILELVEEDCVSSLSVMVNGPNIIHSSKQLLKLYSLKSSIESTKISLGLHLNLTQFAKVSSKQIQGVNICDEDGQFLGKPYLYEHVEQIIDQPNSKKFIEAEIKAQIQKFVILFGFRPSHIDGHNHIHVIPEIAQIISDVTPLYGIYHTRIPLPFQSLKMPAESSLRKMNEIFVQNAKKSKTIFQQKGFAFPDFLVGLQNMGALFSVDNIRSEVQSLQEMSKNQNVDTFVEIMIHPGYPQKQFICPFSGSIQREHELNTLSSPNFRKFILSNSTDSKLWSYHDVKINRSHFSALIYSKMVEGSGNFTTSARFGTILKSLGFEHVYYLDVPAYDAISEEVQKIQNMVKQFNIKLILGVNLTRTARQIYEATNHNTHPLKYKIPYILVIAGTDANITLSSSNQNIAQKQRLIDPMQNCLCLISLSEEMKLKVDVFLEKYKIEKQIEIIAQSNCIKSIHNIVEKPITISDKPYIVFPTSFRSVKGVSHIFKQLNTIIQSHNFDVLIFGPIISEKYFNNIIQEIGQIKYMGVLRHSQYLGYLQKAFALINCSVSQGMSCSILEALGHGIPVIARKNEGNMTLIEDGINGFLYEKGEDFLITFNKLYSDYQSIKNSFVKHNEAKLNQQFSFGIERAAYKCLLENKFFPLLFEIGSPENPIKYQFISLPEVHGISPVNLDIMRKVFSDESSVTLGRGRVNGWQVFSRLLEYKANRNEPITILDLGCGSGIFAMFILYNLALKLQKCDKFAESNPFQITLYFSDIDSQALSNLLVNLNTFRLLMQQEHIKKFIRVNEYKIYKSSIFQSMPEQLCKFDLIIANLPQSPFQYEQSRLDKNAGKDSLKWHSILLSESHKYLANHEFAYHLLLYSHMAQPKRYEELVKQTGNQIIWISSPQTHIIHRNSYDKMEEGLSSFIESFYKEGKADIKVENNLFYVPADLRIIRRAQLD